MTPETPIPLVLGRLDETNPFGLVVTCPHCAQAHYHTRGTGRRRSHCVGRFADRVGDYYVVDPGDEKEAALTDIKRRDTL